MFGNRTPKAGSHELGETHLDLRAARNTARSEEDGEMGHRKGNPSCDGVPGAGLGAGSDVCRGNCSAAPGASLPLQLHLQPAAHS